MGDGIKFLIDLENRTSGGTPADQKLKQVEAAAHKANAAVSHGSHEFSALKTNIFSATIAGELWAKGLEKGTELVAEGLEKVVDLIKETVSEAAGERREQMAMTNLLGGREDAEKALHYLDRFSELSEFNEEKTKAFGMELLNSGYAGQKWKDAMAAVADVASMSVDKIAGAGEAVSAFSRMEMTGKLDARILKGLHLNVKDVMKDLGDSLGMSPKAVKKALDEGAVPAAKAFEAVLSALERKTGKRLGEAGLTAGKGLDAKLTHWREWPQKIMKAVADSPGMDKIEKSFDRLLEAFDPSGPKGAKMVEGLGSLMDTVGQFIEDTDWAAVTKGIGGVATSLGAWVDPLAKIAKFTLSIAEGLAKLPKVGETIGDVLASSFRSELRDQEIPASHGALKKAMEKEIMWGEKAGEGDLKSNLAEGFAKDIRENEMDAAVEGANTEALRSALNANAAWGRGSAGEPPTKIEAKADVVMHFHGPVDPKDVEPAAKAATEEGMTTALEKTNLQRGTASARRRKK